MKREIKFRGRDRRGNVFYGSYDQSTATINDFEYAECHAVEPESVAQLIGYDVNGKEIYEGDVVIGEYGDKVVARLMDNLPPKPTLQEVAK